VIGGAQQYKFQDGEIDITEAQKMMAKKQGLNNPSFTAATIINLEKTQVKFLYIFYYFDSHFLEAISCRHLCPWGLGEPYFFG